MDPSPKIEPIQAKGADTSSVSRSGFTKPPRPALIPRNADPDEVLESIRSLVTDHVLKARQMSVEAAARFPRHAGIQNAKRVLEKGRVTLGQAAGNPEPNRDAEFQWLRSPPDSLRGQWVALLGNELVGSGDSLAELVERLRSKNLEKLALIHHLD